MEYYSRLVQKPQAVDYISTTCDLSTVHKKGGSLLSGTWQPVSDPITHFSCRM